MRWVLLSLLMMACVSARTTDVREILHDLELILEEERSPVEDLPVRTVDDEVPMMVQGGFQKGPLRVGAFNVRVFGTTKMENAEVVASLLQILSRYDILLFQEIRDSSLSAFPDLMQQLNAANSNHYGYEISKRLGRTNSKEQYAYIYRSDLLTVEKTYQYPDPSDVFEREPFGIIFTSTETALSRIGFLGVHTKPDAAEAEIDAMMDVYLAFKQNSSIEDVMMMGDFNADCSYVTSTEWRHIRMKSDPAYLWLIDDLADTTVSNTNCAYDRFVAVGGKMRAAIVPDSATVYRFDTAQGLSQDEAALVSDHYPIEFQLYGKVTHAVDDMLEVFSSIKLSSGNEFYHINAILDELDALSGAGTSWNIIGTYESAVVLEARNIDDVMGNLLDLAQWVPRVLTEVLYSAIHSYVVNAHALNGIVTFPGIIMDNLDHFTIRVVVSPERTTVEVKKQLG